MFYKISDILRRMSLFITYIFVINIKILAYVF